jgi:hypothetical protein
MRVDCGELDPDRGDPADTRRMASARLDEEELADWRAGRNAVYQLAALTIGARRRTDRRLVGGSVRGRRSCSILHGTPSTLPDTVWRLPDLRKSGLG